VETSEHIEESVGRLEQQLRAQAELYRTLLDLARRQIQEISDENMDAFTQLLEEKKKVIEEIGEIETTTRPLREIWESNRENVGEESRTKLRAVVDEIRVLLEELVEIESQSQQKLGVTRDTVEEHIRQASVGSDAMRSYTQGGGSGPRFMDEVG
jgi:ribosomal 50S subunit-associated protein YjgA (DUF615 family)